MDSGPMDRVDRKNALRALFAVALLASGGLVAVHAVTADAVAESDGGHEPDRIEAADNLTVVTTHFNDDRNGSIAALDGSGEIVYRNDSHTRYFDVDPVPGADRTVEYVAEQNLDPSRCGITPGSGLYCVRQVIERLDLVADETSRVYEQELVTTRTDSWHDVDRAGEDRYLVSDIFDDRVFLVNATSGLVTWEWRATDDFPIDSGGDDKHDWTHVNDVETVRDGVVMASLRNHDQVVFVDREAGLRADWTLGVDDEHDVLYEQHNPDYIPEERGGPAVVVADSENNRIVEYERREGEWRRTWTYADGPMEWPRDADRLPNGHTLITDTHTNRIVEVDGNGEAVWTASYPQAYEAERLGTGDESEGGQSASELGLANVTAGLAANSDATGGGESDLKATVRNAVPNKLKHGLLWVFPPWASFLDVVLVGVFGLTALAWLALEACWHPRIEFRSPVRFEE